MQLSFKMREIFHNPSDCARCMQHPDNLKTRPYRPVKNEVGFDLCESV